MIQIVLRDRYYVPVEAVDPILVRRELEVPVETKEACNPHCNLANKRGRYCSTCPSRNIKVKLWESLRTSGGRRLIAIPAGDEQLLRSILRPNLRYSIIDRRTDVAMRPGLRWTGNLYDGQIEANGRRRPHQKAMISQWRKHVNEGGHTGGIIVSPPRTGKCVVGNTVIHTDRGYETIEGMFHRLGYTGDQERIGKFGHILTPYGFQEIRGLYSRVVASTIEIHFENGAILVGTPIHPLRVERNREQKWVELQHLTCEDFGIFPRRFKSNLTHSALTPTEASLFGILTCVADPLLLATGVVDVQLTEVRDMVRLVNLIYAVFGVAPADHVVFHDDRVSNWVQLLLRSSDQAWTNFISAAFHESNNLEFYDETFAKAAHAFTIGSGISTVLRRSDGAWLLSKEPSNEKVHTINASSPNASRIVGIIRKEGPVRVYDVMVPNGNAFITNGMISHNTVIGVATAMAMRRRTLILASKIDFLRQFGMRFGENTNVRQMYERGRYPVVLVDRRGWKDGDKYGIKVVKKWGKEIDEADVVITPYQQLMDSANGRERIKKYIANKFGLLEVDECHQAGAPVMSRIVNRTNVGFRLGLSATPKRKDQLDRVFLATIGRVVAKGKVTSDLPNLTLFETGIGSSRNYSNWNYMVSFLINNEERNKIIARKVFSDLRKSPRNCILLPTTRVAHIHALVKIINAQAEYCRRMKGENWPTELAVAYYGKSDTAAILDQTKSGRARVVVAMNSMVQHGLDVSRWTHVYVGVIPTSNPYLFYQLGNRVCTPYTKEEEKRLKEKPMPVVRFIIDAVSASVFCFARLFNDLDYGVKAGLTGKNYLEVKLYKAGQKFIDRASLIAAMPKSYSPEDVGIKQILGRTKSGKKRKKASWTPVRPVTRF